MEVETKGLYDDSAAPSGGVADENESENEDHTAVPVGSPDLYSASAQLKFLSHNSAANAELFWQIHDEARRTSFSSESSSVRSSSVGPANPALQAPTGTGLVYVHVVRPTDTLISVQLTYKIDPVVIRRSNRLWSHDTIQTRASVLLPVEHCNIPLQCHLRAERDSKSEVRGVPSNAMLLGWSTVEGVGNHVEVCAVPCKQLGYFPAAGSKRSAVPVLDSSISIAPPRSSVDSNYSFMSTATTDSTATTSSRTSTKTLADTPASDSSGDETSRSSGTGGFSSFGSALSKYVRGLSLKDKTATKQPQKTGETFEMIPDEEMY
ncbi:uncharacterized protein V1516DRAFT_623579 [Lipomyces oligophaga]|uniref:uncharacterized protein n=1 Tax=Lipomyces oligophaga TaxID=45792 RepID=UPI0034CDC5FF